MWVVIGFAALGLLIGNLVGLTSESIVAPLISLLFVFIGGSLFAFLHKLSTADRRLAGASLLALSLACLVGTYAGIYVAEYQVLSPANRRAPTAGNKYVRNATVSRATLINETKDKAGINEAFQNMYQLALEYEDLLRSTNK